MAKINKDNLGYLGIDFQYKLIKQVLIDRRFGEDIIEIIKPSYFEDTFLKNVCSKIKNNYEKYETIPDISSLESIIFENVINEVDKEMYISNLRNIKEASDINCLAIQDTSLKFCKQQELKKSVEKIKDIIKLGDLDSYPQCEEILRAALEIGNRKDEGIDVFDNIEDCLEEDFRNPIPTGIDGLDSHMNGGLSKGELAVILAPTGVGKAQPLTSKILTPNGWTTMGDVKIGDCVINDNGDETKVIGTYPQGVRPIYKVSFNDGTETLCDEEHLWSVNTINQRNRKTKKDGKVVYLESDNSFKVVKTKDMLNNVKVWGGRNNYKVPIVKPVNFNDNDLSIDPYLLGLILGDGCITETNQPNITTKDLDIITEVKSIYDKVSISELHRSVEIESDGELILEQRSLYKISLLSIKNKLIELNLHGKNSQTKFIPNNYLYNSVDKRISLLQGLIDSDGYINDHRIEYSTVSKNLRDGMIELVRSLGGKVTYKSYIGKYKNNLNETVECSKYYRLTMSLPDNGVLPSRLERKLTNFKSRTKYSNNKFITDITYIGKQEAKCIMVDCDSSLYITDDYIVTHNTTISTKIASGAKANGYNALQIFFEDSIKNIQKKHAACWMNGKYALNDLSIHKEETFNKIEEESKKPGKIVLKRMPGNGTTIPIIKQYVKKLISQGFRPDVIILDYIDCVQSSKQFKDSWDGEGHTMRDFETMLVELDMAGWTAVQGHRSSLNAETVDSSMFGGSIKKAQIGHFILSIAKTNEQKEMGTANMAILKSRFGKDGIIFEDVMFNNATIQIEMDSSNQNGTSLLQSKKNSENKSLNAVKELMAKNREKLNN